MRILHIGKFFPPGVGGIETFLAELVAEQQGRGHDVSVLVHGRPEPEDPAWLTRVPVWLQLLYAPLAPGFPWALRRVLREFRPDVVHLHMPNLSAFSVLLLADARRVPWVVHWHADVVLTPGRRLASWAYRLYRPFEQALLARAARAIATSPPYLASSWPLVRWSSKCGVVPLGINPESYEVTPGMQEAWRPGVFRVLAMGRLAHYKGFSVLLQAVAELPGVELKIAGDGEERASLEALARASGGRASLLGAVSDGRKQALLASCDVLCLPSIERSEAFGVVLLEAMRYGKPCIVSDLPGSGMPWVIEQGANGLRVPAGDVSALREAIAQLQHDKVLRTHLGTAGQQALAEHFSMSRCAAGIEREYRLTGCAPPSRYGKGVLVVIPALNEAATIGGVVEGLRQAGFERVVVVDDHSSDGTGELAAQAGATVLRPVLRAGAWGAMQTGIRYAIAEGYDAVVTMDADGQHEVDEVPALLALSAQADVVIGAHPMRASKLRRIAWEWFRRLTGLGVEDLTSGFRYYNARAMQIAASNPATLLDFQDVGVLLMMRRAGLRLVETPVSMSPRAADRSRVFNSWFTVARYMAATTLLCLARK